MKYLLPILLCCVLSNLAAQQQSNVESILETINISNGKRTVVYREALHIEAPNWSPDGKYLLVNSKGRLYRIAATAASSTKEMVNTDFADDCNNDHGISPDGKWIVISHTNKADTTQSVGWKRSTIYTLPATGGVPKQVTTRTPSFWHGWSPDGNTLAYAAERNGDFDIYTLPVTGGEEKRITTSKGLDDGPDYSPDGQYIYYNSFQTGRMQLWRVQTDGTHPEQLTNDEHSNWFPHPSPDGQWIVFISYLQDPGSDHPFGRDVKLRLMNLHNRSIRDLTSVFFGGQGTINVPSWHPNSRQLAFISYKMLEK